MASAMQSAGPALPALKSQGKQMEDEMPELHIPIVGDTVVVRCGMTGRVTATKKIKAVSKTGLVVSLEGGGAHARFYRSKTDPHRFVGNPGVGVAGHILNDYFRVQALVVA
jgi:hypothetical protein